jgi:bifunctional DNase/RNase
MRVGGVIIDPNTQVPVVILRGFDEPRLYVPIYIGGLEATAIATVLAGVKMPRPMTHDLLLGILDAVACRVIDVAVTRLDGGTFYAEVRIADETDMLTILDARPSDALAIALRCGAPILVASSVIDEAGALAPVEEQNEQATDADAGAPDDPDDQPDMPPEPTPPDAEAKKRELADGPRSFFGDVKLEDLVPEDFGKYKM